MVRTRPVFAQTVTHGAVTPSFYESSDQGIYIIVTVSKSLTCSY